MNNRFSIKSTFGVVTFVGVSVAACKYANVYWAATLTTLLLVYLCVAVMKWNHPFWRPVAVFGWPFYIVQGPIGFRYETAPTAVFLQMFDVAQDEYYLRLTSSVLWVFAIATIAGLIASRKQQAF